MDPLPDVDDLAALFGGEGVHSLGDDGSPWPYVRLRFSLERGPMGVQLDVEPASDEIELVVSMAGEQVVHLELHAVQALVVERRAGVELLGVVFDHRLRADGLWLR